MKKYGDAVVLVQKNNSDGSLRRLNAIVLASSLHVPTTADRKPVKGAEPIEHLDIAFAVPTLVPDGQVLKTRNLEEIFRHAYDVPVYTEGAWLGYELLPDIDEASDTIEDLRLDLEDHRAGREDALSKLASANSQLEDQCKKAGAALKELGDAKTTITGLQNDLEEERQAKSRALSRVATLEAEAAKPSAADLDAVAGDQAAKEATQG